MPRPALSQNKIDEFREQIKATGYEMVCEDGVASLTLRGLAKRLNCSYAKPYRYFQGKEELLDAVRAYAYDQFTEYITAVGDKEGIPLNDRYLRFALEYPEAFRLIYELQPELCSEETRAAQLRAWNASTRSFYQAAERGLLKGEPETVAHIFWVSYHGLASLALANKFNLGIDVADIAATLSRDLVANHFVLDGRLEQPAA